MISESSGCDSYFVLTIVFINCVVNIPNQYSAEKQIVIKILLIKSAC